MADNVTLPGIGAIVETAQQPDGSERQRVEIADLAASIRNLLSAIAALGVAQDSSSGRLRVLVDSITASLTLQTVATVSNVTAINQVGTNVTVKLDSFPFDVMTDMWANSVRANIT